MTALQLLAELRDLGVVIRRDGHHLRVRAPKGTLSARLREALQEHRHELIDLLGTPDQLTSTEHHGRIPPSSGQRRLWFLQQLDPTSSAYTIPLSMRLVGSLDVATLGDALTDVVARHETLRSTYVVDHGTPHLQVHPPQPTKITVLDVSNATDPAEAARAAVEQASARPFNLVADLPLRATLVVLGAEDHVLLLTVHHSACDETSVAVLWDELSRSYATRRRGNGHAATPLPVQYRHYTDWERSPGRVEQADRHLAYWQGQLAGLEPAVVPADRPDADPADDTGAAVPIELPPRSPTSYGPWRGTSARPRSWRC